MQMGDYSGAPAGRKRESKALPKTYLGGKSSAWQKGKGPGKKESEPDWPEGLGSLSFVVFITVQDLTSQRAESFLLVCLSCTYCNTDQFKNWVHCR